MTLVTVLMPAYNSGKFIEEAIDSILAQSYKDFNLLVINDGSSDNTEKLIKKYTDSRIQYVRNEQNIGIVNTLNKGINLVGTKYLIRMDSDDVMHSKRIEEQVQYMEKNPNTHVLGTQAKLIDNKGNNIGKTKNPLNKREIRTYLLFGPPIFHPSIIMRTEILKSNNIRYENLYAGFEDYELWTRLAKKFNIENMSKYLLFYRTNPEGITQTLKKSGAKNKETEFNLYKNQYNSYGIKLSDKEINSIIDFAHFQLDFSKQSETLLLSQALINLKNQLDNELFDLRYFDFVVSQFYRITMKDSNESIFFILNHFKTIFNRQIHFDILNKLILIIKKSK